MTAQKHILIFLLETFAIVFAVFALSTLAFAGDFKTGVGLRNEDSVKHKFTYEHVVSTAICEAAPGNSMKMKRGIPSAFDAKKVKGLKVVRSSPDPFKKVYSIKAEIAPGGEVLCLCAQSCVLALENGAILTAPDGSVAVIKDNKLTIK